MLMLIGKKYRMTHEIFSNGHSSSTHISSVEPFHSVCEHRQTVHCAEPNVSLSYVRYAMRCDSVRVRYSILSLSRCERVCMCVVYCCPFFALHSIVCHCIQTLNMPVSSISEPHSHVKL